jgi:hypothetical protein
MGQKVLTWTPAGGTNSIGQIANMRVTGQTTWVTTGFSPANPLSATATTTTATVTDNTIYDFMVQTTCTYGGPTDGGVQQGISFACIVPVLTHTFNSVTATTSGFPTPGVTTVIYSLYDSTNTLVATQNASVVGGSANTTFAGLSASTTYSVRSDYSATVNGTTQTSSGVCGNGTSVTTDPLPVCNAPTGLTVSLS